MSEIKDINLWPEGARKIDWVRAHMPLLNDIEEQFAADKPFAGVKIAVSVHLEAKTAYLCQVLAAGGAQVYAAASNVLSTQDDVVAALVHGGVNVFAVHGESPEVYHCRTETAFLRRRPRGCRDFRRPSESAAGNDLRRSGNLARRPLPAGPSRRSGRTARRTGPPVHPAVLSLERSPRLLCQQLILP